MYNLDKIFLLIKVNFVFLSIQLIAMISRIVSYFEQQAFGVCDWWGKKLGLSPTKIRMYFIYLSFFTVGSPIIVYFVMAFILEHKDYFKPKHTKQRQSIWDIE